MLFDLPPDLSEQGGSPATQRVTGSARIRVASQLCAGICLNGLRRHAPYLDVPSCASLAGRIVWSQRFNAQFRLVVTRRQSLSRSHGFTECNLGLLVCLIYDVLPQYPTDTPL